jgi:hypothetical protein
MEKFMAMMGERMGKHEEKDGSSGETHGEHHRKTGF